MNICLTHRIEKLLPPPISKNCWPNSKGGWKSGWKEISTATTAVASGLAWAARAASSSPDLGRNAHTDKPNLLPPNTNVEKPFTQKPWRAKMASKFMWTRKIGRACFLGQQGWSMNTCSCAVSTGRLKVRDSMQPKWKINCPYLSYRWTPSSRSSCSRAKINWNHSSSWPGQKCSRTPALVRMTKACRRGCAQIQIPPFTEPPSIAVSSRALTGS